jgi:hypothetical protein
MTKPSSTTRLPEQIVPGDIGHREAHRILRADYEAEHGSYPECLTYAGEHALLHAHLGLKGEPPSDDLQIGHTHHHELLARAFNERQSQ